MNKIQLKSLTQKNEVLELNVDNLCTNKQCLLMMSPKQRIHHIDMFSRFNKSQLKDFWFEFKFNKDQTVSITSVFHTSEIEVFNKTNVNPDSFEFIYYINLEPLPLKKGLTDCLNSFYVKGDYALIKTVDKSLNNERILLTALNGMSYMLNNDNSFVGVYPEINEKILFVSRDLK